jgi:lipase
MNSHATQPRISVTRPARGRVPGDGIELAFGYWPGRDAPVVALHGLTASHVNFIGVAERLQGCRPVLGLDLRGRGDSDKPEGPYGMAQHARDVAAAMRAFALGPSIIMGHSMGAFVATALAAQEPELVSRLVLIDGGYTPDVSALAMASQTAGALELRVAQLRDSYPSRQAYKDFWRAKPHFPVADWNPWVEAFLDYEVGGEGPVQPKASEVGVRADLFEGFQQQQIADRLASVRVPLTLIRAEKGFTPDQPPLYPDSKVQEMRALAPQLQDVKVPCTTHYTIVLGETGASRIANILAEN